MNVDLNKQHVLRALWILSISDVIILISLFFLAEHYSQPQLSGPLQHIFVYISLNFPTLSLLISVGAFITFATSIYLLQRADNQQKSQIERALNRIIEGQRNSREFLSQHVAIKQLTLYVCRLKSKLRRKERQSEDMLTTIESLGERKSHYFMLLDLTAIATLTIDDSQQIVQFNQAAQRLFGYQQREVIGQPLTMLLPIESRATHHEKVTNFGESAKNFTKLRERNQVRGLKKDGEIFSVDLDIAKVQITQENLFIASITDTTERIEQRKKLAQKSLELEQNNQQLQQYQQMLEDIVNERTSDLAQSEDSLSTANQQLIDAEKMAVLGEMVSSAAHEINTPIGIGITCASNLLEATANINKAIANNKLTKSDLSSFSSVVEQSANIILNNMERAAGLVHSFKAVSSDQVTDMQRTFNLHEYLEEILLSLYPKFCNTDHQIVIICDDAIILDSKPGALSQIITNLIINSLIHGFEFIDNGQISIEVSQQDKHTSIVYKDNGKGLNAQQESRLFEPFYTTKKEEGGTGLGMHIVEDLAKHSLKGDIKVIPCEQGITFNLSFPSQLPTG